MHADLWQTRAIDLPSDSNFAVAMRTQQQAEREEQQRIKNLVLNYDLTDDQQDGEEPAFHYVQSPNSKRTRLVGQGSLNKSLQGHKFGRTQRSAHRGSGDTVKDDDDATPVDSARPRIDSFADETGTIDGLHGQPRFDKAGNTRSKQRARKLQLGDIDWYGNRSSSASQPQPAQASLDSYVVEKKPPGLLRGNRHGTRPTG